MTAVPAARRAPVRAAAARALFRRTLDRLRRLEVIGPDGTPLRRDPGAPRMVISDGTFFDRLGRDGKIGFGESYMAGEWHADDLPGVLTAFAERIDQLVPRAAQRLRPFYEPLIPRREDNSRDGARDNIARHYDLSNDLFSLFLDETMTYSAGVFEPGDDLGAAQRRKYDAILDLAGVRPGEHVLEIGSGWGGLAIHAARERDVRVTTATISPAQFDLATRRVAEAGLAGRVEVVLEDYRDLRGAHDRIVSVEMFEAVGERYWPAFFGACDRLLRPGGAMAMQTITMPHRRFRDSRRSHTWMHRYIFPGGLIPSEQAIGEAMARASRLRTTAAVQIGHHYVETLRHWRARFLARRAEVRALGFDEPFVRMWEFYLAYCQAGFATGTIGDVQLRLERHA